MKPFRINEKRFPLPITIISDCPKCGRTVRNTLDGRASTLSFPIVNEDMVYTMYHQCDEETGEENEWAVSLRINLDVVALSNCLVES